MAGCGPREAVHGDWVITQGRGDRGMGQEFAQHVMIQYWEEKEGEWRSAGGRKEANIDTFTPVVIPLRIPVITNRVRIVPVSQHPRTVCIRLEVCGCNEKIHDESDNIPDTSEEIIIIPTSHMFLVIGVLVTIIIILVLVMVFIIYNNNTINKNNSSSVPKSNESHLVSPEHYKSDFDSSTEYSSPLINTSLPPNQVDWDTCFPPPPSHPPPIYCREYYNPFLGTLPPRVSYYPPPTIEVQNHYASSAIIANFEEDGAGAGHYI